MTWDAEALALEHLLAQFRYSDNILGLIGILSAPCQDTADMLAYLDTQTDVDTAEGVHLGAIGARLGVTWPSAQEANDFRTIDFSDLPGDAAHHGTKDFSDPPTVGGWLVSYNEGLESQTAPGTMMGDDDYRILIKAKGAAFLRRATTTNWWIYLNELGADCFVDTVDGAVLQISPKVPGSVDHWIRGHALDNGFRPAGVAISFNDQRKIGELLLEDGGTLLTEDGDEILLEGDYDLA